MEIKATSCPICRRLGLPGQVLSFLAVVAVLAFPAFVRDPYVLQVLILIMLYGYWSTAWNLIGGYGGQLALGHAAFAGIGAYTSTLLFIHFGVTPWLGMFVGGAIAAALSLAVGYPTFKLRGPYFVMATVAVGEVARIVFQNTQEVFGLQIRGARGILIPLAKEKLWAFQFPTKVGYYYVALGMLGAILLVSSWVARSKLGFQLAAIREDEDAAEALGVDTSRAKLLANAMSAFFTAVGGTFYAQFLLFIDPMGIFGAQLSTELALMAIVGGEGTVWGPLIGALILVPVSEVTRMYLGGTYVGVHLVAYGAVLMVVIMFMPQGVIRLISSRRAARGPIWTQPPELAAGLEGHKAGALEAASEGGPGT